MTSQPRIKLLLILTIVILLSLFALTGFQLFKLHKAKKQIAAQKQTIERLEKQIDYHENKLPNSEYENILGDN